MRKTTVAVLFSCLALTACGTIEADPTFLVIEVGETTYDLNVTSGRPDNLVADNWYRSKVGKAEFAEEVRQGDHVVCHLVESDGIRITGCRKA